MFKNNKSLKYVRIWTYLNYIIWIITTIFAFLFAKSLIISYITQWLMYTIVTKIFFDGGALIDLAPVSAAHFVHRGGAVLLMMRIL